MDLVDPILSIAEKLYALCSEVKANKKRCKRLADRVRALTDLVIAVKQQGLGSEPTVVRRVLSELKLTLESAQAMVNKYASSSYLRRIVKAHDMGDQFGSLNERLNEAAQQLSLALQIEQRDKMKMFEEDKRRKEDEEDRKFDYKELQKLLQALTDENEATVVCMDAVHATVEQTQKDVKDILESLRKPSIHLQDIREIRSEELTYDFPIVPIMKSGNFEVYKGEYNKFTVAIKKYTASTSAKEVRKIFRKEVETMKRFESPHILRMFGICVQNENGPNPTYLIVTEFCEMGSLRQVLDGASELPWGIKTRMCLDAAQGLYRLHLSEQKYKVHGCISSSKFLVSSGYRVKLGGFELAKTETSLRIDTKIKKYSLAAYLSPQQLENVNHHYDKVCEIYSFGIVLWEIATRQVPFKGLNSTDIHKKVCKDRENEPLSADCPGELKMLTDACRSYEEFQRPNSGVLVDKLRQLVQQYED